MGRPGRRPASDDTPRRIREAAELAFARDGFAATRLEDVAAAAGITRPSLLHHFGSKQDLYREVLVSAVATLAEELRGILARTGGKDPVIGAARAYHRFLEKRPGVARLVVRELLDGDVAGPSLTGAIEQLVEEVAALLAGGRDRWIRRALVAFMADGLLRAAAGERGSGLWRSPPGWERELAERLTRKGSS